MTTVTRWNPFKEMEALHQQMTSLADRSGTRNGNDTWMDWMPYTDVIESKDEYLITIEVPGVQREDIQLTVENGVLTVTGSRQVPVRDDHTREHLAERVHGRFARRFNLPEIASTENVNASLMEGLLKVRIPKREAAKPKQVEISVG